MKGTRITLHQEGHALLALMVETGPYTLPLVFFEHGDMWIVRPLLTVDRWQRKEEVEEIGPLLTGMVSAAFNLFSELNGRQAYDAFKDVLPPS